MSSTPAEFFYLDDDRNVQGPFASSELQEWRAAGYFTEQTLLLPAPTEVDLKQEAVKAQFKPFAAFFPTKAAGDAATAVAPVVAEPAAAEPQPQAAPVEIAKPAQAPPPPPPRPTPPAAPVQETTKMTDVDEAAPAQAAESSSPAPAAAPPATAWFYLDDTGAERGPFSTADMTSWHAAGYFTGETKVRSAKEDTCKPLSERPKDAETFVPASSATAAADAPVESVAKSSAIEDEFEVDMYDDNGDDAEGGEDDEEGEDDQKDEDEKAGEDGDTEMKDSSSDAKQPVIPPEKLPWFYTDKDSIIRGPFSPVTMLKWHRAGFFAYNKTKLRRQDEEEAKTLEERTTAPSFYLAASLLPRLVLEDRWYYLDSKDAEHGPFTGGQMRAWYEGGFLKKDLRVRQLGEKEGDWRTMEQKQCEWMKPLPPKPVVAAPPQPMQQPYGYNPNPYAPPPAAFGQHPPPAGPYGHAHSPYPSPYAHPAPPPPPRQPRADYAQTLALQGRGARHAVNAAFVDPFSGVPPADPSLRQMNHFMNTSELDRWQEEQTRRQQERQQQGAGGGGRGGYHQQQGYRGGRR